MWSVQGKPFTIDVWLIQLDGCDMVLGVHWLKTLGEFRMNLLSSIREDSNKLSWVQQKWGQLPLCIFAAFKGTRS